MARAILIIFLGSGAAALVQMFVPLFGRFDKRWSESSRLQRFCGVFFPVFFALVIILFVNEYRLGKSLSLNEQLLLDGQEYCLVTDIDEISDADFAYEIRSGEQDEKVCAIISKICVDLGIGNDSVHVRHEGEEFLIVDSGDVIGRVTMQEKKRTTLLKIYWIDE